jgi:hypothetical protein
MKTLLIIVVALAAALAVAACGSDEWHSAFGENSIPQACEPDTSAQVAKVLATPAPEGVDTALWEMLKNELARELAAKTSSQAGELLVNWTPWIEGVRWDNQFMRADGNDDGIINIADLTPIVLHFGERGNTRADYNENQEVDVADITQIALAYGLNCGGFVVEYSSTSPDEGYEFAASLDYSDYYRTFQQVRQYRTECYPWEHPYLSVRLHILDRKGSEIGISVCNVPVGGYFPGGSPELTVSNSAPTIISWSTYALLPDANQDGAADWFDVGWLEELFGADVAERPESQVADYNLDGVVGIPDLPIVAVGLHHGIQSFEIEVSTQSFEEGFVHNGSVDYFSSSGFDLGGFRYYEYEISSPPPGGHYWVRAVSVGQNGESGHPGPAVEITP